MQRQSNTNSSISVGIILYAARLLPAATHKHSLRAQNIIVYKVLSARVPHLHRTRRARRDPHDVPTTKVGGGSRRRFALATRARLITGQRCVQKCEFASAWRRLTVVMRAPSHRRAVGCSSAAAIRPSLDTLLGAVFQTTRLRWILGSSATAAHAAHKGCLLAAHAEHVPRASQKPRMNSSNDTSPG